MYPKLDCRQLEVGDAMVHHGSFPIPPAAGRPSMTMLRYSLGVLLLLSLASGLRADWTVTVRGGAKDQKNVPVKARVDASIGAEAESGALEVTVNGKTMVGQLTGAGLLAQDTPVPDQKVSREVHFVLPELPANSILTCEVKRSKKSGPSFAWKDEAGNFAELSFDGRPVIRYMYTTFDESTPEKRFQTYKIYHHMYDPSGKTLVTKGFEGQGGDFPHHRGVFYGFNKISYGDKKTADVWHCNGGEHQGHEKFVAQEAGPVLGRHLLEIGWYGKDKKKFATELREITIYNTPGGTLLEFASRLESLVGPIKLDGDPQHAGFQFRAALEVKAKTAKQSYYVRPDGVGKPGETRNWPGQKTHADLPWDALSFVVEGNRYTCAYLDRPQNPKEARFSERDYGRFGSYFEAMVDEKKPLELNYRLWLQAGEMKVEEVDALSKQFTDLAKPTVK